MIKHFVTMLSTYLCHLFQNMVQWTWDKYFAESLKNCTREKRGVGFRRKVTGNGLLPTNWITFLRCSENKAELFPYLSNVVGKEIQDKVVVSTVNENVVTNGAVLEISSLMQCNIEEADERIFVQEKVLQENTLA